MHRRLGLGARLVAAGIGLAGAAYATYVGVTWYRYGHPPRPTPEEEDDLLDRFMPAYEVVERHHVRVDAPAAVALAAAQDMDLLHSPLVRAIIKGRELILGAKPDHRLRPRGLLAEVQSLGWGVLAEVPGLDISSWAASRSRGRRTQRSGRCRQTSFWRSVSLTT